MGWPASWTTRSKPATTAARKPWVSCERARSVAPATRASAAAPVGVREGILAPGESTRRRCTANPAAGSRAARSPVEPGGAARHAPPR